ncbi:AMP-binding protein [Lichenicoccus sp.]|uniref:AMP-binding protein n=1 Tax=Lichenicoccus sp. TaxID=2781899 RepID=UPI003D110DA5
MNRHELQDLGGGTISGLLAQRARYAPANAALVFNAHTYSFADLDRMASIVAAGLITLGLRPGDVAATFMGNRPEHLFTSYGGSRAGVIRVPVNTGYKGALLAHVLAHSEAKLLVMEAALADALASLDKLPSSLRIIVCVDGMPAGVPPGDVTLLSWEEMLAAAGPATAFPVTLPHDVGGIGFTSGTTGRSKGVVSPQFQALMMAKETAGALGFSARDRVYTCMPLFHGMASVTTALSAMYAGAATILSQHFSVSRFWDEVRDAQATQFSCLGSMLHMLLSAPPSARDRDHRIERVFAAPAPPEVLYRFESRFGVHIVEGYGQTEIKNILYNPLLGRRIGSMGKPTPSSILEIHDENGQALGPGEIGELVYRPKVANIMMKGYLKEPEKTLAGMQDLWWHTGDMASMDGDGFFYFFDRKTDSLRRRGENISSQELEGLLAAFQGVREAAAVATPSEVGEDEVLVVLEVAEPATFDLAALHEHCQAVMPKFMVPRYYRIISGFPRTPTGKVQKAALRADGVTTDTWDARPARVVA